MGKIKRNSLILLAKEGLLNLSAIFVVGYMAKQLGAEDYGKFTYSISFAVLFSIISNLGIRQYATREIIRNKDKAASIQGRVLFTRFVLTLIMFFAGVLTSLFLGHDWVIFTLVVIALSSKIFFTFTTNNYIIFESHEDLHYNALTQTIGRVVVIVFTLGALFSGFGLYAVALIYLLGDVVQYAVSLLILRKNYFKPKMRVSKKAGIGLLKHSVPFALFGIFYLIYFEISKIMLFQIDSVREVGVYQAASILAYKFLIVSDSVGTAIFPKIIEFGKTNHTEYKKLTYKAIMLMFGIGFVSALGLFIFSDFIINIIYRSKDYTGSIIVLQNIAWVLPLLFLSKILSFMLISKDRQNLLAGIYGIMVITLIVGNWFLIPTYHALGAAWAMIISESVGVISFVFFYKALGLKGQKVRQPIIPTESKAV